MAIPEMDRAFAGMKADAGFDRVESYPVASAIDFGAVCGTNADGLLVAGAGTQVRGVALHSHTITGGAYKQYDAASVMRRGLVWCAVLAGEAIVEDTGVKFDAAGLAVANASTTGTALPNAVYRSGPVTVEGGTIALVELHAPTV